VIVTGGRRPTSGEMKLGKNDRCRGRAIGTHAKGHHLDGQGHVVGV
jgi:hypothetical protein